MNSPRETLLCHYRYDALDRLIGHVLPDRPMLQRFYCKSRLATEIQGTLRYSIIQHDDLLLAQQKDDGNARHTTLLTTDQQRSVLQALKADNERHPIAYSPYGHHPTESGLTSLLGFNGERPDSVTGDYLLGNGYRAFNPVLMRFNSPDSLSPFGKGGLNPYSYCEGDSINRRDPSGNAAIPNFLSKAFRRLRKAFNKPKPTYKSGEEGTFTNIKKVNRLENDGTWMERTYEIINGKQIETSLVYKNGRIVNKFENGIWRARKYDSTLQELSYSQLTPEQMKHVPRQPRYQIDTEIDTINLQNAFEKFIPMLMQQEGVPRPYAFVQAKDLAMLKAMNGEITGVKPDKINQLIRAGIVVV